MLDGAELCQALTAHPEDVETALTEYEQAMFPRSTEIAVGSAGFGKILSGDHGENAAQILIEAFTASTAGERTT